MSDPAHDEFDALYHPKNQPSITHPEDCSGSSSDNDSTTLHSAGEDEDSFPSGHALGMPAATYHIPRSSDFTANTGPKGVIADARSYELAKKRNLRQTLRAISTSPSPPLFSKNKKPAHDFSREKSASPDVSLEDDEDEFMRTWRANRLDELAHMSHSLRTRRHSPSQRRYGSVVAVDPLGYLDAVEKVPAETVVVVLIYDDESAASQTVEDALQTLARKHATTRFVKLHHLDAEMDEIAAPGILAYKGGDCFSNLISIMSELPAGREMNSSSLESILQRHLILH